MNASRNIYFCIITQLRKTSYAVLQISVLKTALDARRLKTNETITAASSLWCSCSEQQQPREELSPFVTSGRNAADGAWEGGARRDGVTGRGRLAGCESPHFFLSRSPPPLPPLFPTVPPLQLRPPQPDAPKIILHPGRRPKKGLITPPSTRHHTTLPHHHHTCIPFQNSCVSTLHPHHGHHPNQCLRPSQYISPPVNTLHTPSLLPAPLLTQTKL